MWAPNETRPSGADTTRHSPDLYATEAGLRFELTDGLQLRQLRVVCVADLFRTFSTRAQVVLDEPRPTRRTSVGYATADSTSASRKSVFTRPRPRPHPPFPVAPRRVASSSRFESRLFGGQHAPPATQRVAFTRGLGAEIWQLRRSTHSLYLRGGSKSGKCDRFRRRRRQIKFEEWKNRYVRLSADSRIFSNADSYCAYVYDIRVHFSCKIRAR